MWILGLKGLIFIISNGTQFAKRLVVVCQINFVKDDKQISPK